MGEAAGGQPLGARARQNLSCRERLWCLTLARREVLRVLTEMKVECGIVACGRRGAAGTKSGGIALLLSATGRWSALSCWQASRDGSVCPANRLLPADRVREVTEGRRQRWLLKLGVGAIWLTRMVRYSALVLACRSRSNADHRYTRSNRSKRKWRCPKFWEISTVFGLPSLGRLARTTVERFWSTQSWTGCYH